MEREINIQDLVMEIFKRWWIVAICVILCGTISLVYYSNFVRELFKSTGSVYVDNKAQEIISQEEQNNTANLYDLTTAEMLVDTYIEILSSNGFFNIVEEKIDVPYTSKEIRGMVSYSRVEETGIIYVDVVSPNPVHAQEICQGILDYANLQIMNIMEVGSVKTIDDASLPEHRCYPSLTKTTILGMLFGFILSVLLIFVIKYFDVRVKTVEDIENKYDLVVLGTIPNMDANSSGGGDENA